MKKPGRSVMFPRWARGLGWLAFALLALATLLVVTRWIVMESGHREAQRIVNELKQKHSSTRPSPPSPDVPPAPKVPGMPLSDLPHFGDILVNEESFKAFYKQIDEISEFLSYKRNHAEMVDGIWSFRATL